MKSPATLPPRLGLLLHRGRDALFEGFMSAMSERGHVEGQTITIEARFAEGVLERTPGLAEDLVRHDVDLIVAIGAVGASAARAATATIPIVFAIVLDPVDAGFAASLERPGGNMTGVTNYDPGLALAQLTLLRDVVPGLDRVAVLSDADIPSPQGWNPLERSCERAAASLGIELDWFRLSGPAPDRVSVFREMGRRRCKAVQVLEVPTNIADFGAIAALANDHRIPTIFPGGWHHEGLMSYGTSLLQTVPELPAMVDLILNGADPAEVPIRQVRQHRLCVNLATARRIGVDLPSHVIERADETVP